ncbi:phosphatase PAP2 family protein [Pedobacter sp.]|uniref:phosphatase PAP2 family protein n=1 Tax=Pedobacter sp. TaxID=1411316 RepID=UPI00396C5CCD
MKKTLLLAILLLWGSFSFAKTIDSLNLTRDSILLSEKRKQYYQVTDSRIFIYQRPKLSDAVNNIPKNFINSALDLVSKQYYPYSLAALGGTVAMIPADPWLIKESRNLGESLGLSEDHYYKSLGFLKIIPDNVNSAFYFLGNGTTVFLISGGLAAYGIIQNDYRSLSTSLQLIESLAVTGLFVQPFKRLTGRESPFVTAGDGRMHSRWHFAPSFKEYHHHTSKYDAMPSGHLTTAMSALVIIAENYPEKVWIKPVGYSLLGVLCFEMMQSKVHWASDYPIALLLGYVIGKNIAGERITKKENVVADRAKRYKLQFTASSVDAMQTIGLKLKM